MDTQTLSLQVQDATDRDQTDVRLVEADHLGYTADRDPLAVVYGEIVALPSPLGRGLLHIVHDLPPFLMDL